MPKPRNILQLSPIKKTKEEDDSDSVISDISLEDDAESAKSEDHKISFPDADAVHPSISQSIVQVDPETLNCTIRIAKKRPPTAVKNQGRHVSAYALMLLVIKNRLEGENVKDVEKLTKELIKEYIEDDQNLKGFLTEIDELVKKSGHKKDEYEKRLAIYKADIATAEFLSKNSVKNSMKDLEESGEHEEMVGLFKKMLTAHQAREKIAPMDVRNMIKRAQEAYSPFISDLIAITIIIFNRTTDAAKDFPQPTKKKSDEKDSDDETLVGESGAIKSLQEGKDNYRKDNDKLDGNKIAKDLAALFDYKYDLVLKEYEENHGKDGEKTTLRNDACHVMRRHIKMCYDAFPFIKEMLDNKSNREVILKLFAGEVLEKEGWKNHKYQDFTSQEKLYERILKQDKLEFNGTKCILADKSKVKKKYGAIVNKLNESRGGSFPNTSFSGQSFFQVDDEEALSSTSSSEPDSDDESLNFITMDLPNDFTQKYQEFLKEESKELPNLAELEDEDLAGNTISNDERFVAIQCFLEEQNIPYEVSFGLIKILDKDNDEEVIAIIPTADITAIRSNQTPAQIAAAKESRLQAFKETLLNAEGPIFFPINFSGHFTLLAIDAQNFRYIDTLRDAADGDIPQELIFQNGEAQTPFNPIKDLFTDIKKVLDEEGYEASDAPYVRQQYSKEIHQELIKRRTEALRLSEDLSEGEIEAQIATLEEDTKKEAHNNECGFLVAANTVSLINKSDINADLSKKNDKNIFHLDSLSVLKQIRPAFKKLFEYLREEPEQELDLSTDSDQSDDASSIPSTSSQSSSAKKIAATKIPIRKTKTL